MIETVIIVSLVIFGIHVSTREDMLFGRARAWFQTKMDNAFGVEKSEWLMKPLSECQYCMSSIWVIVLSPFFGLTLIEIPITILAVCGIIHVICLISKTHE